ncbi:DinB family protein [Roseisolibacter sp. H3M3-2]|uniref:DinB family protein n=1 Tax=Roseisolibacter sp. H3M3-2 TaxID=3031323 RepID=UPI0023DA6964|nr:DinB family protein [Roseisolibacter sp. H3M3-2]MDF1501619.1 DinB family protein [Roseisolibacter sp. H3M3-2]
MTAPEPWLRGPVPGVPPLLQPAAHALQQARELVARAGAALDAAGLWASPGNGAPSVGWHVLRAVGALDRLLTYARGAALDDRQRDTLAAEAGPEPVDAATLLAGFEARVAAALAQLAATPESSLLDPREVGRARLPSNVLGLLFHAAEHTQRHVGAVVATARATGGAVPPG